MAQEKLGREAMLTQAFQGGLPIVSMPSQERFARLDLDLQRDLGESGAILDRYRTDVNKFGVKGNLALGSNNALLAFLGNLYGSMGQFMPRMNMNLGLGGGTTYYG